MREMNNLLIFFVTLALSIFGYLNDIYTPYKEYHGMFFYLIFLYSIILLVIYSRGKMVIKNHNKTFYLFVIFILTCFVSFSRTFNMDYQGINFIIIIFSFFILNAIVDLNEFIDIFLLAQIIGFFPTLKFLQPMNTIGVLASYVGVISYIYISRNYNKIWLYVLSFVFFSVIIYLSESRTSLLIYLLITIILFLFNNTNLDGKKILLILSLCIIVIPFINWFLRIFDNFFLYKWNSTDLSSGRLDMWRFFLDSNGGFIKLFGNGNQIVGNYFRVSDVHNIFIQILIQFGLIPLIVFIIFLFSLFIEIYKLRRIESIFFVWFLSVGLFENIFIVNHNYVSLVYPFVVFLSIYTKKVQK